jgi:hypothetical protein
MEMRIVRVCVCVCDHVQQGIISLAGRSTSDGGTGQRAGDIQPTSEIITAAM